MAEILLGVTGSIAAYKACDLASNLRKEGHSVTAIITAAAAKLVAPYALRTLTSRPVIESLFPEHGEVACPHIAHTDRAELMLVAPATANFLAKAAMGLADDALSTTLLSVQCPVLLAPAMNHRMWNHPTVRENIRILRDRGTHLVEPEEGRLACGWVGQGRLASVQTILQRCLELLPRAKAQDLDEVEVSVVGESLPRYQTSGAAGMDLCSAVSVELPVGETRLVQTGIRIELPAGYEAQIRPRSGLSLKHQISLLNSPGTIDSDYRGEISVILYNAGKSPFMVQAGQRIAQMVVSRCARVLWRRVDRLGQTKRGSGGFGHTGEA